MIYVTFDSNVFQNILKPDNYKDDSSYECFCKINQAIREECIIACISDTIFTYEAIIKKERKKKLGDNKGKTILSELSTKESTGFRMTLGPGPEAHLTCHPILHDYLDVARSLGVKTLHAPRIGSFINDDLKKEDYLPNIRYSRNERNERQGKCLRYIEGFLHCGKSIIDQLIEGYNGRNVFEKINNTPDSEKSRVSKALAEWADGDSIAAHYGYGNDYFCTRDEARGAGRSSVFAPHNRKALSDKYSIKFVSPDELYKLL
jgi:hypothetical protein